MDIQYVRLSGGSVSARNGLFIEIGSLHLRQKDKIEGMGQMGNFILLKESLKLCLQSL